MKKDYHVHSSFSDGKNTPEELILTAIERGMTEIGFSDHSYTPFDESYCLKKGGESEYFAEICALKEKYRGKIKILCGIEQDYYSESPTQPYDYVIGSVHFVKHGDIFISVDESADSFEKSVKKYYGGDYYAFAEDYFGLVSDVVEKTGADIIGHFDLICKFNEKSHFFDENDKRYVHAYKKAADKLLKTGKPFEINIGVMARGYKTVPYPSPEIQKYLKKHGASFIITGDVHNKDFLGKDFGIKAD